jgi:hypothetical protein
MILGLEADVLHTSKQLCTSSYDDPVSSSQNPAALADLTSYPSADCHTSLHSVSSHLTNSKHSTIFISDDGDGRVDAVYYYTELWQAWDLLSGLFH